MDYSEKWQKLGLLGGGGQGKVYRVIPKSMGASVDREIIRTIEFISNPNFAEEPKKEQYEILRENLLILVQRENPQSQKALKVLHKPEDARDAELSEERIKREIEAMAKNLHPNLLKIVDHDSDSKWFVSEYYPKGPISKNMGLFAGNFAAALKAFRPLVEGVAQLHKNNLVHRDIKPENVFLDSDNNLILGDFGLVFFMDYDRTRISARLENVGSRDWMPGWAQGRRIEDIKPTFDVFSLGKLLWALVSGQPKLLFWYFDSPRYPEFNVESLFPKNRFIELANPLFKKCIVEHEDSCLPDASALLEEVDKLLSIIEKNAAGIKAKFEQRIENLERDVKVLRKEVKELERIVISEGSALSKVPKDRLLEIRKQDKVDRLVAEGKYEQALAIDPKQIVALTGLIEKKVADSEYREAASYTAALKAANGSGVEFSAYPDLILAYDKLQEPAEAAQLLGELDAAVTHHVSERYEYYSGSEQLMWLNDSLKKVEPQISDRQLAKAVAALVRKIENTVRDMGN